MTMLLNMRNALLFVGLMAIAFVCHPQDINFKDLSRTGPPVVKTYTVEGIEADGREYLLKFDGVDTSRVETRNAMLSSGSSSSSSSSSSNSNSRNNSSSKTNNSNASNRPASSNSERDRAPATPQAKVFSCKFYCKSASGPTTHRDFTANSRREAAKLAGDSAHQVCNSKGLGYASSVDFSESQCFER